MRRAVLLGNPDTKRTVYLKKAAEQTGLPLLLIDWERWNVLPEGKLFLKIDPPLWGSCSLQELDDLAEDYRGKLKALYRMQRERGEEICFFNHPLAIETLLDKRRCKGELLRRRIPVTEQLEGSVRNAEELLERMEREGVHQVFIKPVYGSGAAGVSAFRINPGNARLVLYTCAFLRPCSCPRLYTDELSGSCEEGREELVNTKRLRKYTDREEIFRLLDHLLKLDCIVERWYAKAECRGFSYDLRVVMQENRLDTAVARLSKGPVTNLHLNNRPLSAKELHLPAQTWEEIERLCRRAMGCFEGLRSAGIDILLEKGKLRPRIIEMNAQGDLIYQDIYGENLVYRHQAEMMKTWVSARQEERRYEE